MISKWYKLKPDAILLRRKGKSIKNIRDILGIPLATLSGWLRHVQLTDRQKSILKKNHEKALVRARKYAVNWHKQQKVERLKLAESEASKSLSKIKSNEQIIELALALLYLGEGFKKTGGTGMGNSDPLILKFFLGIMRNIYNIDINKIRLYLHLRADQDPGLMRKYWSKELQVPIERFGKVSIDQRTTKKETYSHYKGVCIIHCANVAIQRKLVYIGTKFCEQTIQNMRG